MKSTILNLNKRVLVVEKPKDCIRFEIVNNVDNSESIMIKFFTDENVYQPFMIEEKGVLKPICGGSGLSEEIAKELVKTGYYKNTFFNYNSPMSNYNHFDSALDSFISAIEANNFYWKDNPLGDEPRSYSEVVDGVSLDELMDDLREWQEAESRTFNPEQTLIFEIL